MLAPPHPVLHRVLPSPTPQKTPQGTGSYGITLEKKKLHTKRKKNCEREEERGYQRKRLHSDRTHYKLIGNTGVMLNPWWGGTPTPS